MKNAIVKLGFCLLFFLAGQAVYAAPPTVSATRIGAAVTNAPFVDFNVVFDQSVTGLSGAGDFDITGSGAGGATAAVQSGSGASYVVRVSGYSDGTITLTIKAGAAQNGGAEGNLVSSGGDPLVIYDNTKPDVTLNKKSSQGDPTGVSPIFFTAIFDENINAGTLEVSDFDASTSTTGGTITVASIIPVSATEYDIEVTFSGGSAGNVILTLPAGGVSDLAGNTNTISTHTDNVVARAIPPPFATPTVTGITTNAAQLHANITSDGGSPITSRGFLWKTTPGITFGDPANNVETVAGTSTGAYDDTPTFPVGAHIYFVAFAENAVGPSISTEGSFYTFAPVPGANAAFSLALASANSVTITYAKFNTIADAAGYLIARTTAATMPGSLIADGKSTSPTSPPPASDRLNYGAAGATFVRDVTDPNEISFTDTGLAGDETYVYVVIPYGQTLGAYETNNYRSGFDDNTMISTLSAVSDIDYVNNTGTDNIDYASFQSGSLMNDGSNSVRLAEFSLRDGGTTNDADNQQTELTTLTVQITNPQFVRTIAVFDNSAAHDPKTVDPSIDTYTFTIPAGILQAADNDTDEFEIRASFKSNPITDGAVVKVTITGATTLGTKSGMAAANAGGSSTDDDTNLPTNVIQVTANHLSFISVEPGPIAPGAEFAVSIEALDANNNRDTNIGNTVTISATSGGTLQVNVPDALTKSFTSGVINWTKLKFQFAGSDKILKVDYNGGGIAVDPTAPGPIVESPGVLVTVDPAFFPKTLCFGDGLQTPAGSFTALGFISIEEQDPSDLGVGSARTFSLKLPDGFIFNTSLTPTPTINAGSNLSAMQPVSYIGDNIVRLTFTVIGNTGTLDKFTITGLAVKYAGTTTVGPQSIIRFGGTAQVKGDDEPNNKSHGLLAANATGTIDVEIRNTNGGSILPGETSFDAGNSPPIVLEGYTAGSPVGSGALAGVFSGDGVLLGSDGKYKFFPTQVTVGPHDVTFEHTAASAPFCKSVQTVTFTVFAGIINGLHTEYCDNETPAIMTGPTVGYPSGDVCNNLASAQNGQLRYRVVYRYFDWDYNGLNSGAWVDIPGTNNVFDPSAAVYQPIYTRSITQAGRYGIYIAYFVEDLCVLIGFPPNQYDARSVFIPIKKKPVVSIIPNPSNQLPPAFICSSNLPVQLTGSPQMNAGSLVDGFWASPENTPGTVVGGVSGSNSTVFNFNPGSSPTGRVQINYRWEDTSTGCSNTASTITTVFAKPTAVVASQISMENVAGNINPEFCESENLTLVPFKATPAGGVFYNWYSNTPGTLPLTASENQFFPSSYLIDGNADQQPDITTTTFNVTRITNRSIFFNGCESDPLALTVKIDDAPTVDAGITTLKICSGNSLTLLDLGADITVGQGHTPPLGGTWSSTGGGEFVDVSNAPQTDFDLARKYIPSPAEVAAQRATITLTSDAPGGACGAVSEDVTFEINSNITVTAVPDFTVCASDTNPIEVSATLSGGLTTTTWTETGLASIPVADQTKLTAKYQPTVTENLIGSVITFTIETADPDGGGPCLSSSDIVNVTISKRATVDAGPDLNLCSNSTVQLAGTIPPSSSATSFTWTTVGLGAFDDDTAGDAIYTADISEEVQQTDIKFILTSNDPDGSGPNGPCVEETDEMIVRINPEVVVSAPANFTVCQSDIEPIRLSATLTGIPVGVTWTENGQATITPGEENSFATSYKPTTTEAGSTITFTVTTDDPNGPCGVSVDQVAVQINKRATVLAGADITRCSDQTITLGGSIPPNSGATAFTWTGGTGTFVDNTLGNTVYDASAAELAGETFDLTLTSNDPDGIGPGGPCPQEIDIVTVTVHPKPGPPTTTVGGINPTFRYCVGDAVVNDLTASGTSPRWYSDVTLLTLRGTGSSFASGVATNVDQEVTFYATQTTNAGGAFPGCESIGLPITIIINPRPVPSFRVENLCLGDEMLFIDETTVKQPTSGPARTIDAWRWDFNDGFAVLEYGAGNIPADTRNGMTTGTYQNPGNTFPKTGLYNVRLEAKTSDGCVLGINAAQLAQFNGNAIRVGPVPVADFTWNLICNGDDTEFTYSGTDVGEITDWAWDFGDASGTNTSNLSAPEHNFTGVGTYDVTLTVTTGLNCSNTIVKKASILPYITTFPYIEPFENTSHGWVTEGFNNGVTSWNLLTGTGGSISSDPNTVAGPTFWATHKDQGGGTFYSDNERSVLYGPCVDMTKLTRPVLAMDYMSDTEPNGDGAYLEVMDESAPNPVWVKLGDDVSGLDWYNENSIGGLALANSVGQNVGQFGWSGDSQTFDAADPQGWRTGRYNLDSYTDRARLRFRLVFGSNASPLNTDRYDGFAMDYFKLESRNRTVLVENFTSTSAATSVANNTGAFKAFPSAAAATEVVKIEYHTGLPVSVGDPADPIFAQNPMDPNARASFYGLSAVPRGYIDGYTNITGNGMFGTNTAGQISSWASTYYSTESLVTSPLDIVINTPAITNGVINITGTVTAKEFALKANQYSLYVVVVEETVGSDSYVLRKMLPSASGRKVPATAVNGSFDFSETWNIDRAYLTANPKLIAVAFVQSDIQNPVTLKREVLQAALNDNVPTFDFTTGIEIPVLEQTALYPNPADRILNIELPHATQSGVEVSVIDQLGRAVVRSSIGVGERKTSIDTGDLSGAVYIVQLKENGVYTNRRLLITHRR